MDQDFTFKLIIQRTFPRDQGLLGKVYPPQWGLGLPQWGLGLPRTPLKVLEEVAVGKRGLGSSACPSTTTAMVEHVVLMALMISSFTKAVLLLFPLGHTDEVKSGSGPAA